MSEPATPLHLSWNTYSSVYSAAFGSLRKHPKYQDVTLVVDDGHVMAHKILLTTCSPLLASIMELSPNPGVVYLNHISITNLNLILDFMYTGEANVDNEDLNEFLAAASTLKVMGLTENSGENAADMEVLLEDETTNEVPKISEDLVKEKNNETPNRKIKAKRNTSTKKRKSTDVSASNKKQKSKVPDVEPDLSNETSNNILGKIRNENEPDSVECVEISPLVPEKDDDNLNDSEIDLENTIHEITLEDDPDEDQAGKLVLTRNKEDQAMLKEIFDSFSKTKKKGPKTFWECTECNRDFTTKRYVDSHIDFKHTDHVLHKCLDCGMVRKSSDALSRHIGKLHKKK